MQPENKTIKDLSDIELAVLIRDHMNELQRIQSNLMALNQELESRKNVQKNIEEEIKKKK